jgi:hypothetical protein
MDTIREQIIKQVMTVTAPLSSLPVERARRSINDTDHRFVSVWDGDDETIEQLYGEHTLEFPIAIECVWKAGKANPSESANALIGTIISTLMALTTTTTFSQLTNSFKYVSSSPSYPVDGSGYTSLVVGFVINYTIMEGDPYNQPD